MNILSLNLPVESRFILVCLRDNGATTHDQLAKLLNKSRRTIYRYLTQIDEFICKIGDIYSLRPSVSNLTPCSSNINTTTTDTPNNCSGSVTSDKNTEIYDMLVKYRMETYYDAVMSRIKSLNVAAVEYIVKDCRAKESRGWIKKTFSGYFLACLVTQWDQAVIETTPKPQTENCPVVPDAPGEVDPAAVAVWEKAVQAAYIPAHEMSWFSLAKPVRIEQNELIVAVRDFMVLSKITDYITPALIHPLKLKFSLPQSSGITHPSDSHNTN